MKLSIIKPLFIDKYNINVVNSLYKICPIYPYQCVLNDNNILLFGFSIIKLNKRYSNTLKLSENIVEYKIKIILQILTNKEYNNIFFKYKIGKNFIYSTIILHKNNVNHIKNQIKLTLSNRNKEIFYENNSKNIKYDIISLNKLSKLIKNNKTLFETGAGISYKVIPSLDNIRKYVRINYNTEKVLNNPSNIIKKLESWFKKVINSKPTIGHIYLQKICKITNSNIITGNFDMLHEQTGIIPIRVHKYNNYKNDFKKNKKYIKLLVVIGISMDFLQQIEYYRKNKTKIVIFVLNKLSIPDYVKQGDYIIIGDLHKNLKLLYKKLLN
jgi:NAD-dependent SIR2 family protein deacetylase